MIRKAVIEDIDRIFEIENKSFELPWSYVSIEAEFYKDYSHIYVYEIDKYVVAYIIVWDLGNEAELITIATDSRNRNQGIANNLLSFCIDKLGNNHKWFLEVSVKNDSAMALYSKHNFTVSGVIKDYYGDGLDAFRMSF